MTYDLEASRCRGLLACIHRIQSNAAYARGFVNQIVRGASSVPGHHRPCGQRKTQRVRLIVEVQNDLPRHKHSPEYEVLSRADWKDLGRVGAATSLTRASLSTIVT